IHVALRAQNRIGGLALSSPYLGPATHVPAAKYLVGQLLARATPGVSLPSGLKPSDGTRTVEIAEAHDRHPMNFKKANVRWYTETIAAQTRALAQASTVRVPIFCLQAGADKIALPEATDRFMERVGSVERRYEKLPGLYHEILNE